MSDEFDGLDATEKAGIGAALNRCRVLAAKIANELRNNKPEHFVDKLSLADIHACLERAADVLGQEAGTTGSYRKLHPCPYRKLRLASEQINVNITSDDARILPHHANPAGLNFGN